MKSKELIKILQKDPEATVWIQGDVFDKVGDIEHERESINVNY